MEMVGRHLGVCVCLIDLLEHPRLSIEPSLKEYQR